MAQEQKGIKVIIYQDSTTGKELCRDTECLFEPQHEDVIDLDDFPLTNSKNSHKTTGIKWIVKKREIRNGILIIDLLINGEKE